VQAERKPHPKIRDVAALAGVSVTTVSRVLNRHPYVRMELRDKVDGAIERLGYSPSSIARSLVRNKTDLIGVIASDVSASFFATILGAIEERASRAGYAILVGNIMEDLGKELRYLEVFRGLRVDGIILMHEKTTQAIGGFLETLDIPVVLSSVKPPDMKFPSVNIDDETATRDAVAYLVGLGHRRIALIGGDRSEISSGLRRFEGYRRALEEAGLPFDETIVKFGDFKIPAGYRLMGELLESKPYPDAVLALSDDMAVGALNRLFDEGLKVPGDISVMGFDDSTLATMTRPALTTVHQPITDIGAASVDLLIRKIKGGGGSVEEVILGHRIVERSSCAPRTSRFEPGDGQWIGR
jgi:LacI family transcriptional regulator